MKNSISQPAGQTQFEELKNKISILVSSCDLFYDVWLPNFCLWAKFWPDCPFPVYLITNHITLDKGPIKNIRVGEDQGWSGNLITALKQIPTPYVFYFQEDHFLLRPVDTTAVLHCAQILNNSQADFFLFRTGSLKRDAEVTIDGRLVYAGPRSELLIATDDIHYKYKTYRSLRCDPAIWRKDSLLKILNPGESAWDFLYHGRSRAYEHGISYFCSPSEKRNAKLPIFYMKRSAVRMNLWHPQAVWLMFKKRIPFLPLQRPVMTYSFKLGASIKKYPFLSPIHRTLYNIFQRQSQKAKESIKRKSALVKHMPLNSQVHDCARKVNAVSPPRRGLTF